MTEKFTTGRRGGTITELRNNAYVAGGNAGAGRGGQGGPTADELRANSVGAGRGSVNPEFVNSDNNYSHEGNNYVTSSTNDDVGNINLNQAFLPNLLDNYDVVTDRKSVV